MKISSVPLALQQKIQALTEDDQFQQIFAEDQLLKKYQENQQSNKIDYRICQLVVDYLISKGKLKQFFREFWIKVLHGKD